MKMNVILVCIIIIYMTWRKLKKNRKGISASHFLVLQTGFPAFSFVM